MDAGARCPHRRALLTICMGYRHRRALLTPARVISPSRCQQPPHDVNDPLTVPTTRVHTRGSTRARARPQEDCSGSRTTPSEYAHKDPDLRNTHRTQGRNQALVCGPVLPNPLPCVRHQRTRTPKKDGAKEQTHQPVKQTSKPANPRRKGRLTAWGPPAPPGKSHPHHLGSRADSARGPRPRPFAGTPWAPRAAAGGAAPPGEPRPQRRPTAVASPRGAGRRCHP